MKGQPWRRRRIWSERGGAVRVGMEDNVYYARGVPATSNAQLVERTVRIARELNMEPASPEAARAILGVVKR